MDDLQKQPVIPIGELFTRVYGERRLSSKESASLRSRLGAYVQHDLFQDHWKLSVFLKKELGFGPEASASATGLYHHFDRFFLSIPIDAFLNVITLVWRFLFDNYNTTAVRDGKAYRASKPADQWQAFVIRALKEENVAYMLDEKCGVRHAVDEQFELQRASMLRFLEAPRYAAVLTSFVDAHRHFGGMPQDRKAAIRALFESAETLVKLMVSTDRLTAKLVSGDLKQLALMAHQGDRVAERAISKTMDGFADWVDGVHNYRHGHGQEEPVDPPLGFTIYVMSSGAAYIRWMAEIDTVRRINGG